jgi:UDP-glucose 4-epimerase
VRYLVTGGAGYIGGVVARQLLAAGNEVVVYDNLGHGKRGNVPKDATLVEGDIADAVRLKAVFAGEKFDGVLHFAALIEAGESMRTPEKFFINNTAGSATLLEAVVKYRVPRVVFSSTAAVYGNPERVPIEEDARLAPTNVYGESKLLTERMLWWLGEVYDLRYAALRYFNVAGALETPEGMYGEAHEPETHLIPLMLDVAMGRRENIRIFGTDYDTEDGTCVRDYIHVADIGRAHLLAMEALGKEPRMTFNLGNGRGFSVRQVIEAARKVTGHAIPVIEEPRRAGDPARLVASSEKIQRELGWKAEVPELEEILRSAWAWHQQRFG